MKHIVLLDLKEDCSSAESDLVISRLQALGEIAGVHESYVSKRTDTGDPRALSDYDLMLYMEFTSLEMLKAYAKDESHLSVRASISPYLEGVPRVIDSMESLPRK